MARITKPRTPTSLGRLRPGTVIGGWPVADFATGQLVPLQLVQDDEYSPAYWMGLDTWAMEATEPLSHSDVLAAYGHIRVLYDPAADEEGGPKPMLEVTE